MSPYIFFLEKYSFIYFLIFELNILGIYQYKRIDK